MFQNVDIYSGDPILSLMDVFKQDSRHNKVNLSIGFYYDEQGITPQLQAVVAAQQRWNTKPQVASLYLPMEGLQSYRNVVQQLLFGDDHAMRKQHRITTIQTIGGSGALRIGADFIKRYFPGSEVWVSSPTWENHHAIFSAAGFKVNSYPYFDAKNLVVKFEQMMAVLQQLPAKSVVLLHPCCHNPTGADLSREQWDEVVEVISARELIPFLDIAYLGLTQA